MDSEVPEGVMHNVLFMFIKDWECDSCGASEPSIIFEMATKVAEKTTLRRLQCIADELAVHYSLLEQGKYRVKITIE
jgi:hypothetical protein